MASSVDSRAPRKRRSNAERRASTRAAVLDATIEAIVRYGYKGATSTRIAELSGFTRGAQMHHFGTKAAMVGEALLHLHEHRIDEWMAELERELPKHGDRLEPFLWSLWRSFHSELFMAAMELRLAARSDPELKAVLIPAEREIGRRIRRVVVNALDEGNQSPERLRQVADHVVNAMRGMTEQWLLSPNAKRERHQLRVTEEVVRGLLAADPAPA